MRSTAFAVALVTVVAGCGGSSRATVVRITANGSTAQARAVHDGRHAPLRSVISLVPKTLPDDGTGCDTHDRLAVSIVLSSGAVTRYRCPPASIATLASAVMSAAREWDDVPVRSTRIVGATPEERRIVRQILVGMHPTRIRTVSFERADAVQYRIRPHTVLLHVDAGRSTRGWWEATLLSARYVARAETAAVRKIGLQEIFDGLDPNPRGFESHRFLNLARVRGDVAGAVGAARLVELRDEGGGLVVLVRTRNPASFLLHDGPALVRAVSSAARYVGIEDLAGVVVYAWAGIPTAGMVATRSDLESCGPIQHSTPAGYAAPPCPAR